MAYIYPKFSKYELIGVRFGGAGLGNLLFTWARVIAASEKYHANMIWPTWPSVKLGPWIRRERDKRFYGDLFKNRSKMCGGLQKYVLMLFARKIHTKDLNAVHWNNLRIKDMVVYDDYSLVPGAFQMNFQGIMEYREVIKNVIVKNLGEKGNKALSFNASKAINVHVRLGDFSKTTSALDRGKNNIRIRLEWYVDIVCKLREAAGWTVPVNVFSDGTDAELSDLLNLPYVQRVSFGNSIADILALSRSPVMIASGSSFSLWARFLGNCSSISYPTQIKDFVHVGDRGFEIELALNDYLNEAQIEYVREVYEKCAATQNCFHQNE